MKEGGKRGNLSEDASELKCFRQTAFIIYFSTMIIKAMQLMGSCIKLNLRTKCVHNIVTESNYLKLDYW